MIRAIFTDDVNIVSVSGLTQWDYGRKLHISGINLPDVAQVHFASQSLYAEAVIRLSEKVDDGYMVDIPNECLREPYDIKAWVYEVDEGHGETLKTVLLPLFKRTRPKDFVNPPDPSEETLLNKWIEKMNENIEDNANFKADITESEKVRVENEETRKSNETARKSAETKRANAESARATAETSRANAENTRVTNENARKTAESGRVSAENTRVTNENARKQAETNRAQTWNTLKNDIEQTLQSGIINDSTTSGTKTWSSTKINYEITNAKNTLTTQINAKAPQTAVDALKKVRNITLPTTGWSSNKRSINVDGITLNDTPLITLDLSAVSDLATKQTQKQEWSKIIDAQTRDNWIDFYCSEVPTVELKLIVKGV